MRRKSLGARFPWLECLIALAAVVLFFQIFPSAWYWVGRKFVAMGHILDARWDAMGWRLHALKTRLDGLNIRLDVLDVRRWSRLGWFVANLVAVGILLGVRFFPDMKEAWARYREAEAKRRKAALVRQSREAQRKKKLEEHQLAQDLRKGPRRRIRHY